MKRENREKILKIVIPIIITTIILSIGYLGYKIIFKPKEKEFLQTIDTTAYAKIKKEVIYGIHLNFDGEFEVPEGISNIALVLTNGKEEVVLPYEEKKQDTKITFTTSKLINDGINLEKLPLGTYYLLLRGTSFDEKGNEYTHYFSVTNDTYNETYKQSYGDLEYYTLTKENKNNKINIEWNTEDLLPTLKFTIKEAKLPDDVYDITIDPGHGGSDPGALGTYNGEDYYEADLNLDISLKLKKLLEQQGYKVAITRTEDTDIDIYNTHGSATLANETSSKFNFAIHHNSFEYQVDYLRGLEVYVANDTDFTFANILIDHITKETGTIISPKETYQTAPGIYQRYFSEQEIADDDIQPSNKTTNMIYYYNIRELGGISTGATNDGRYEDYPKNPYYGSNHTTEPYLLELGYINNTINLQNLLEHKDDYAKAIADAIIEYVS